MDQYYQDIFDSLPTKQWFTADKTKYCSCKIKGLVGAGLIKGKVEKVGGRWVWYFWKD